MHYYRDVHEFHNRCYYCIHQNDVNPNSSIHPPSVCEQCPGGLEGCYDDPELLELKKC